MKRKFKTWQLALILCLSIIVPMATVLALAQQTETCKGHHPSRKDFYKHTRLLPPVTVTEIVGNRLNYALVEEGIELGSLELENNYSIIPSDFEKNHTGCFGIVFCEKHLVVLQIDPVNPKECKTVKQ